MNHIYMCHHFIRDYVEDGKVEIQSFRSEKNTEDPLKKNLSNETIEYLESRYVHRE